MTRRRIIFRPSGGIGFWITPEINGDHDEFLRMGSADTCDLTWAEMKSLFYGVQTYDDFKTACDAMQRCFHSSIAAAEPEPPLHLLTLDDIHCDELYEIGHGEVRRMYDVNPVYVQIYCISVTDTFLTILALPQASAASPFQSPRTYQFSSTELSAATVSP